MFQTVTKRRHIMKKIIAILFISALCLVLAGMASAGPIKGDVFTNQTYDGNDNGSVDTIDGNSVDYLGGTGTGKGNLTYDSETKGTWEYTGPGTLQYIAIKAGDYTIYLSVTGNSGTWDTSILGVFNPEGIPPGLSHISFYGIETSNVPAPAAVWLLGTGLVGLFGIRRKMRK